MAPWKTHFDIDRVSGQSRNRSRSRPQRDHPTTLHALVAMLNFGCPLVGSIAVTEDPSIVKIVPLYAIQRMMQTELIT
jgi:hypothetical protein